MHIITAPRGGEQKKKRLPHVFSWLLPRLRWQQQPICKITFIAKIYVPADCCLPPLARYN